MEHDAFGYPNRTNYQLKIKFEKRAKQLEGDETVVHQYFERITLQEV